MRRWNGPADNPRFADAALVLLAASVASITACDSGGALSSFRSSDRVPAVAGDFAGSNLLVVTLDTTRADRLGCYGYDAAETPALDGLAESGILFTNAVSPAPTTLPSHSSLMTGLYPLNHGARANNAYHLDGEHETLAETLAENGYSTAAVVSAFVLDAQFGIDQGFATYDDRVDAALGNKRLRIAQRTGDETTTRAVSWLREKAGEQFFLWVHLYDAHAPYTAPAPYSDRHAVAYDAEIAFADAQLARLLAALDELELSDRTLVVVAGDHGEGLGQHGETTHASLIYESTMRVPLVMAHGELLGRGVRVDEVVSLVDIMPTVLSMLGIPAPEKTDGRDLTRPITEAPVYMETLQGLSDHGWAALLGVRIGPSKLIHGPESELFDLSLDSSEEEDLWSQEPELASEMLDHLRAFFGDDLELAAVAEPTHQLSQDDLAKLQSLGYLAGGTSQSSDAPTERPHPRDMIPLLAKTEAALLQYDTGGPDAVIAALEQVVRDHPEFVPGYQMLGMAYLRNQRLEDAEAIFDRQLALRPDDSGSLMALASLKIMQREVESSIELYRQVLARWPDHLAALHGLGRLLLKNDHPAEALELFLHALDERPRDESTPDLIADALLTMNRADDAISLFRSRLEAQPSLPLVRNALARVLASERRYPEAIDELKRAIERTPDQYELVNNLAFILATVQDPELRRPWDAAVMMEQVCDETGYREPRHMHTLSLIWAQLGRLDEAIAMAERAREIASASPLPTFVELAESIGESLDGYRALQNRQGAR